MIIYKTGRLFHFMDSYFYYGNRIYIKSPNRHEYFQKNGGGIDQLML